MNEEIEMKYCALYMLRLESFINEQNPLMMMLMQKVLNTECLNAVGCLIHISGVNYCILGIRMILKQNPVCDSHMSHSIFFFLALPPSLFSLWPSHLSVTLESDMRKAHKG